MTPSAPGSVHVIGTGLIGTSIGLALRRVGTQVSLEDADADALAVAVERGAGVRADGDPDVDLVVVSVPPDVVGATMARAGERWPTAVITDVASVKAAPLAQALAAGAAPTRLVGGHPMAGREVSGPEAARADLFEDRVWVLTPLPESAPGSTALVEALVAACGAMPVVMSARDHDDAVAVTSHAPQVLASALAARLLDLPEDAVRVSGQGLVDMTRIADSDAALWATILSANAGPVAAALRGLIDDLSGWEEALASSPADEAGIREAMSRGSRGRARVPGKHGARQAQYALVPVMVKDEPGELARLFVAAGDLGINLEDVRIEHVLGRPSGLIELSVRQETGGALVDGLRERGFDVRA